MPVPFLPLTDDQVFSFVNVVLPCWLCLVVAPKARFTTALVFTAVVLLSVIYALGMYSAIQKYGLLPLVQSFTSLDGIAQAFSDRSAVVIGWIHYGVTDLLTGYWEAKDAANRRVPRVVTAICLFFTMMFGPVGVLLHLISRTVFGTDSTAANGKKKKSK